MLTWSSCPADDGIESTEAGWASDFDSDTSDAAVYCTIMNPEFIPAALGDRRHGHQRRRQRVQHGRDGLAMEVAAGDDLAGIGEDDRVVRDRADLDRQDLRGVRQRVAEGSVYLRGAPERVGILDQVPTFAMRGHDLAICQQPPEIRRRCRLPGMGTETLEALVEGAIGAKDGLDGHRGSDIRRLGQQLRPMGRKGTQRQHPLCAVYERDPLLRLQRQWFQPGAAESNCCSHRNALEGDPALTDQWQGQVRERREVAGGSKRALLGHDGEDLAVQELDQPLRYQRPDPGMPECQDVGSEQEHRPYLPLVQGRADADGMGAEQVMLEAADLFWREAHARQASHACGHAVDGLASSDLGLHNPTRYLHALERVWGE